MQIRTARASDAAHIASLSNELGYPVSEEQMKERLLNLMNREDNAVFVMEIEGDVAAWVHVHGRHLLESPSFAEIGGLVVSSLHRRKRIGEQLMRECEAWAREQNYPFVRVRSSGHRKEAHQFYERIGYTRVKSQEVFNLELS
ncbi:GNAT family N-acetyltransferase [Paenibacillus sp. TAB 01]|uniref:GNAT family N-acetyltransferase n=1 Tax=Paenibacillus sp. TAB 01 TaxID=3368988 RepID=UPI003752CEF6